MNSNPKIPSQELDIYKNYVLNEISKEFKNYGNVEPKHLKTLLDIDIEVSEVTELIYPKIKFTNDLLYAYNSLDKFNLIDKPNDLFDNYYLEDIEIPMQCLMGELKDIYINPYSSQSEIESFIERTKNLGRHLRFLSKTKKTVLTNGDEQKINFIDNEITLPIDYTNGKKTELNQYKNKIKEILLTIFKKVKPISSEKLALLVNKHYNNEV